MDWKPIASAPKDGTEIIVGFDIATVWIVRSARWVRAEEWVPGDDGATDGWWSYSSSVTQEQLEGIYAPTHWLIEVPTEPLRR